MENWTRKGISRINVTPQTIEHFVGEEADYYIEAFGKVQKGKKRWNWPAAIFGFLWMAYRGMYLYAFCFYGLLLLLDMVQRISLLFGGKTIGLIPIVLFLLISSVITGLWGNTLYFHFFKKRLSKGYIKEGTHGWVVAFILLLGMMGGVLKTLLDASLFNPSVKLLKDLI